MQLKRIFKKMKNIIFKKTIAVRTIILAVLTLFTYVSIAQPSAVFIENKGQWNKQVMYKTPLRNGAFFLRQNGFTVVQHQSDDLKSLTEAAHHNTERTTITALRSHAYEVDFVKTLHSAIRQEQVQSFYHNYFLDNDPAQWTTNCKVSSAVIYENIYPGIDAKFYTAAGTLKYDVIVKPFADPTTVQLMYNGVTSLSAIEGKLSITTSVGTVQEFIPSTYTIHNGIKTMVPCTYSVSGTTVRFNLGNYDHTDTLVIDPQLAFSTYTGSTADNWGYTATYGTDGSMFTGSIVLNSGFPVTIGAYQTTYNGGTSQNGSIGCDVAIMKFNSSGTANLYATYLGGSGNEVPFSLIADAQNNLVIAGRTNSANFPATQAMLGSGGGTDIFISKLNATGTSLLASKKIGGSNDDGINISASYTPSGALALRRNYGDENRGEVVVDVSGNIIVVSNTQSADSLLLQTLFNRRMAVVQDHRMAW